MKLYSVIDTDLTRGWGLLTLGALYSYIDCSDEELDKISELKIGEKLAVGVVPPDPNVKDDKGSDGYHIERVQ